MCLAVPMRIVEIKDEQAVVELGGVKRTVSITLIKDQEPSPGDYVIVHAGFALQILDEQDAAERLEYVEEMMNLE